MLLAIGFFWVSASGMMQDRDTHWILFLLFNMYVLGMLVVGNVLDRELSANLQAGTADARDYSGLYGCDRVV